VLGAGSSIGTGGDGESAAPGGLPSVLWFENGLIKARRIFRVRAAALAAAGRRE
jgi:hypothetical protein